MCRGPIHAQWIITHLVETFSAETEPGFTLDRDRPRFTRRVRPVGRWRAAPILIKGVEPGVRATSSAAARAKPMRVVPCWASLLGSLLLGALLAGALALNLTAGD